LGFDIVSLDEGIARLSAEPAGRPFVVLTFDDAYRDNLIHALPILRRHEAAFTLYVPTALVDGEGEVWWQALEDIIAARDIIALPLADGETLLPTATLAEKRRAYDTLYWRMRRMPEPERVAFIRALAGCHGYDLGAQCRAVIMDWEEIGRFAAEPLCTVGAHTAHHYELAKLPLDEARSEIARSIEILEAKLGSRPEHLSYPIGSPVAAGPREFETARELGLRSAVTTRPGALYARHRETLTALPRVSLNGLFQERRDVDVFTAGALFSLNKAA